MPPGNSHSPDYCDPLEKWKRNEFIPWNLSISKDLQDLKNDKLNTSVYTASHDKYKKWKAVIDSKFEGLDDWDDTKGKLQKLKGFDAWQSKTEKRLGDFDKWQSGAEKKFGGFETWKTDTNKKLGDFATWKTDTNKKLGDFTNWQAKTDNRLGGFDAWQKEAKADLANLHATKLDSQQYLDDQKQVNQGLMGIAGLSTEFNGLKSALHTAMPQIQGRLESLENKTNALDTKVTDHDRKIAGFDGEFLKVRSEIQKSNVGLGERIEKQGRKMDEGFEELKGLFNKRPNGANQNQNASPAGGGDGGGNSGPSSKRAVMTGCPDLSNKVNLNINQHSPHCNLVTNNSYNDNSPPYYGSPCPCQAVFMPPAMAMAPSPWVPIPGNHLPAMAPDVGYAAPPAHQPRGARVIECESYEPIRLHHRRRSHSDLREGASNYNFTPNIKVALGREVGGGPFSKPKKEALVIGLGGGGGGGDFGRRRKHKSSSDFNMFS